MIKRIGSLLIIVGLLSACSPTLISEEEYNAIEVGMTQEEVSDIVGGKGKVDDGAIEDTTIVNYDGEGDIQFAVLLFDKGKLWGKERD
ncbi:hypothetical protein AB3X48_07215 [Bacillus sp. S4]|uniref:hypothetical protein n=1 Tax=Bacillus TaxID=1386 RepID=UPI000BEF29D2|nr:hypothetical protein [Bacillus mycoides]PEK97419.1 hypothetical protein CN600_01330 [Bacillus mycoides]QWG85730.1 hypothetical protein EXW61_20460 [Bacillus mycoides]HDR7632982.1 hypothetical protein [Bacillus mycoides]